MFPNENHKLDFRFVLTVLIAFLGVTLYWAMFYDAGYGSGFNDRKAKVEAAHYASDTPEQIERECGAKTGQAARECIATIIETERESERNESDLAAQWKAADWVMIAGAIAGAQLLATIVGLYYIKGTLDQTVKAVEETTKATRVMARQNDIAVAQARPYLVITNEYINWSYDYLPQYRLAFNLNIENVGATVAMEFQLSGDLSIELDNTPIHCAELRSHRLPGTFEPRKPIPVELAAYIDLPKEVLERVRGNSVQVEIKGVYSFTGVVIDREVYAFKCKGGGRPIGQDLMSTGGGLSAASFESWRVPKQQAVG